MKRKRKVHKNSTNERTQCGRNIFTVLRGIVMPSERRLSTRWTWVGVPKHLRCLNCLRQKGK